MTTDILESAAVFRTERVKHLLGELDALTFENSIPGRRLSIYFPAGTLPGDDAKARGFLRDTLDSLRERISDEEESSSETRDFLCSMEKFARGKEKDTLFWSHQLGGVALFADSCGIRLLEVRKRFLPAMYFSTHWHLTPLLELGANVDRYWLIALGRRRIAFYQGSRLGIRKVGLPDATPPAIPDAAPSGKRRRQLKRFFDEVDEEAALVFEGSGAPLLLAGNDEYLPIYREVCRYTHLSGQKISGNPEDLTPDELHAHASEALRSEFGQSRKRELLKIREKLECNLVHTEIRDVLAAAEEGRVAALMAPGDAVCWGRFDPDSGEVETLPETDFHGRDLYQEAAEKTLLHGGELFYLESSKMPHGKAICAELRY